MIILDTNIISELMKPIPDKLVINWMDNQKSSHLFITTITIAEISYGLHALPEGKRRNFLINSFDKAIMTAFIGRILTFDELSAHQYGKIMSARKELGQPLGVPDGQIASIASRHGAMIATRNIRDFLNCGLQVINPFNQL